MSYTSTGRSAGARARPRVKSAKSVGSSVGAYSNPATTIGAGVGGYAQAGPASAVGGAVGGHATPPATQVGTPPISAPGGGATLDGDAGLLAAQDQGLRTTQGADLTANAARTANQLGYGFDANGQVDAVNNPYSRVALALHMAQNQHRGNTNSYAAAGQLYSGALQNAQNETERQNQIGLDQLYKQYQGAQSQVTTDQLAAYTGAGSGVTTAAWNALIARLKGTP